MLQRRSRPLIDTKILKEKRSVKIEYSYRPFAFITCLVSPYDEAHAF